MVDDMDSSLAKLVNASKETARFVILVELYAELERASKLLQDPLQTEDTYNNLSVRFDSFQKAINIVETASLGE